MNTQRFACSRDKFSKIITGYVILLGAVFLLIPLFTEGSSEYTEPLRIAGVLILLLILLFYFLAPISYTLNNEGLTIERKWKSKLIPADQIIQIRLPEEKELSWPIRTFGNGGLFGYTGRYYSKHIGSMIWYCSRRDRQLIIERLANRPVIISPDEPARLVWAWGELKRPSQVSE